MKAHVAGLLSPLVWVSSGDGVWSPVADADVECDGGRGAVEAGGVRGHQDRLQQSHTRGRGQELGGRADWHLVVLVDDLYCRVKL